MARLQVGQKSRLASKSSKSFCRFGCVVTIGTPQACLATHHFAQVLARRQRLGDARVRPPVAGVPAGKLRPPQDDCGFGH
jgi:hypothetical protein